MNFWLKCGNLHRLALFGLGLICTTNLSAALQSNGQWPQWRGPDRDGISKETHWSSEGKEESLWELEVGLGYSAVSIRDGRLYTMGFDEDLQEDLIWCVDAKSGEKLWVHSYSAKIWNEFHGGGTLTTPTIVGDALYILNREGQLFCLDLKSGKPRWHRELMKELKLTLPQWGFSASPLFVDGQLIINVGSVLSVDPKTGKTLWETKDYKEAYSTPTAFSREGKKLLAVFNGYGLAILERANGKEVSSFPWKTKYEVNAASPIVIDDAIFISSGYDHGAALVAMDGKNLEEVWSTKKMRNHMDGCVLIDGYLYGFDDKTLTCMNLEGKVVWSERGLGEGSLSASKDKLLVLSSKGDLIITKATPKGYAVESKTNVLSGGAYWTHPTLVDGLIYCRNSKGNLVCRDHRIDG
jgi:outer membrane protein assembly factor BamB